MEYVICTVRDAKSEVFGRPFFVQTVGAAIRSFDDEVNRAEENNIMYHHPEDFSLWQLGIWEDIAGTFNPMVAKMLVQGNEVKKIKVRENNISAV